MASATGQYTGDATSNRTIALAFTPKFVVVVTNVATGNAAFSNVNTGTRRFKFTTGAAPTSAANDPTIGPTLTTNGFIVSGSANTLLNASTRSYNYYAIG